MSPGSARFQSPCASRCICTQVRGLQTRERGDVRRVVLALAAHRMQAVVGHEPQPGEIREDGVFEDVAAADAIVVLDAQQHAPAGGSRHAPHVNRVHDVTEVKVAGGRGAKRVVGMVVIQNAKWQNAKCSRSSLVPEICTLNLHSEFCILHYYRDPVSLTF